MIDIEYQFPDGRVQRVRKVSPVQTRRGAESYEQKLRQALLEGTFRKEMPTFSEFSEEFLSNYAVANNKPSEIASKRYILKMHLVPALGSKRLDEIRDDTIERFKAQQLGKELSPKTINNQLGVLGTLLRLAQSWERIKEVPTVKRLRVTRPKFDFLGFEETEHLIEAGTSEAVWQSLRSIRVCVLVS
jgi:hypothetical protein